MLADRENARRVHNLNAIGACVEPEDAGGISDDQAARMVSELVQRGIPLTLIADLINPAGPDSLRILREERAEADEEDPDDFSQAPQR